MGHKAISLDTYKAAKELSNNLFENPFQSDSQTIIEKMVHRDYGPNDQGEQVVKKMTKYTHFNMEVLDGHEHEEYWLGHGISEEKPVLMEGAHIK